MLRSLVLLVLTVGSPELTGVTPELPGPGRTETPLPPGSSSMVECARETHGHAHPTFSIVRSVPRE